MKKLFIIRHGKSSWDIEDISDFDRPLRASGIHAAHFMGRKLADKGLRFDKVISSPAIRALHTACIFSTEQGISHQQISIEPAFYESRVDVVMNTLVEVSDSIYSLAIVGHNPVWTNLANYLMDSYIENIPTAGIICMDANIETWKDLRNLNHQLSFFDYPKKDLELDAR